MARILLVGGGCRGLELARELAAEGHAVRITTRASSRRAAIEGAGAECFIGTPDRLATLRAALDRVAIACWTLASASGPEHQLRELHTSRLAAFVHQTIDTTARGFVYERGAAGGAHGALLERGEMLARELTALNAIPLAVLTRDAADRHAWVQDARAVLAELLAR